jgi:hypothetical protein
LEFIFFINIHMKLCLPILALALSFNGISQTVCGTAGEGGSVTLTAPAGNVFTSVTFASYGTPNGSCGSFTIGACDATNSKTIVEAALIGNNSASISATNGVFGDPCSGTVKRLYIEAVYSSSLPLHLISFSCTSSGNNSNILQWQTSNEINTQAFEVERSFDGLYFSAIGNVDAANINGTNLYSYTDNAVSQETSFYRLKMIDKNGSFSYSNIIKTKAASNGKLTVFPNPAINSIRISGGGATGYIEITTLQGTSLKRLYITGSTQSLDMGGYPTGMYILKYTTNTTTLYQKVVKQ